MSAILLVEDDPMLGESISVNLELEGHKVTWAKDLRTASKAEQTGQFSLVLLDLGLPDGNGLSFCAKLRESGSRVPVIILTAQTDEDSVVAGLNSGANDYVRKPFGLKELMARVRTALREPGERDEQMRYGDLVLLTEQRKVFIGPTEIKLTTREYDILVVFVKNAGAVVSRERLIDAINPGSDIFDRTIDSHVSHLRVKIRDAAGHALKISPVYGVGYRLEKK